MLPTLSAPIEFANQAPGGSIGIVTPGQSPGSQKTYQASLQGNWRVDLWGERSSMADAAKFQLWQAAFNRDNVQRNLVANLSSSYVEYLSLNDRLRVARETDAILSRMLDSLEKRVDVGDATLIELDQQKASIFGIRATIPILEQQREDALTTIAFLVGSVPGSLKLSGDGLDSLFLPIAIPALPSSLLLRRSDVRVAEARLLAADANVDVARARILPPLDLSAQVGHSSLAMAQFFQPSTLFWNAITNLTVSIFDGGKLKSDKENAKAIHEEMVETYARTIYQAVKEVESSLAAIRLTGNRLDTQQQATTSARRAWDSSAKVYAVGGLDYQALLDAERNYRNYQDEYLRIKLDSFRGYINLFQALGGGVNFAGQLPGKGVRPTLARSDLSSVLLDASKITLVASKAGFATDGIDWSEGVDSLKIENFWQVELPGLYHRSTIGATWRDLRTRYPKLMGNRVIRPRLDGITESSTDDELSLFRLYVSKFSTPEAALELCTALKANFQRCRVISSRSDEEVTESSFTQKAKISVAESGSEVEHPAGIFSGNDTAIVTAPSQADVSVAGKPDVNPDQVLPLPRGKGGQNPLPSGERKGGIKLSSLLEATTIGDAKVADYSLEGKKDKASPDEMHVNSLSTTPVSNSETEDKIKNKLAYSVQLGAFSSLENAAAAHEFWHSREYDVYVSEIKDAEGEARYVVRTGVFQNKREASALALLFKRKERISVIVVRASLDKSGIPLLVDMSGFSPHNQKVKPVVENVSHSPEVNTEASFNHPARVNNDG